MIDLIDEMIGYGDKDWGFDSVKKRHKPACGKESNLECKTCKLFDFECDYSGTIGLAVYAYGNLVGDYDRERELLWNVLEDRMMYRCL